MYIIKCKKTNYYLMFVENGVFHNTPSSSEALVFQNKKSIPSKYINDRWELVKVSSFHKLYAKQNKTLYDIQNATGISHYLLYQYADGKKNIDNMRIDTFSKIADYLGRHDYKEFKKEMSDYLNAKFNTK